MQQRIRIILVLASVAACGASGPPPAREFDGAQALKYIAAQVAFGPRVPGKAGHDAMARWLDSLARSRADSVTLQRWWHKTASGDSIALTNVLAQFNVNATDRVLYIAHWDTRPRADNDPDAKNHDKPIPGADDGGSGVAILLGVADALKKLPPKVGVDLLFVDGEDFGTFGPPRVDVLIGATYYAEHQLAPKPSFAVLWDMVGHANAQFTIESNSQIAAADVAERVWGTAAALGYSHVFSNTTTGGVTDDHIPLIESGIRAIDVIDIGGFPYWHTLADTPDKESVATLDAVGNTAVAVIRRAGAR